MPVESSSPLVVSNQKEVLRCFTVLGMRPRPGCSGGRGAPCLVCCPPVSLGSIQPRPGWAAAPSVRPRWPPGLACLGGADSQQGAKDSALQTVFDERLPYSLLFA